MCWKQRIKNSDHFCVQKTKNKTLRSLLCTESKEKTNKTKNKNQIIVVYTKQRIKNSDVRCNRRPSNKSEKPNNTCMNDSCHKLCGNIHQGERLPHHRFSNLFNVRRVESVCFLFGANVLSNKLQHSFWRTERRYVSRKQHNETWNFPAASLSLLYFSSSFKQSARRRFRPRQNDLLIFIGIPRLLGLPKHAQRSIGYPRLSLTVLRSLYYGLIYMLCQQSHNQSSAIQPITCHQDTQTTCGDITQVVLFHYFWTSLMSLHRRIWKSDVLNWKHTLSVLFLFLLKKN